MTTKEQIHQLVNDLPESDLETVKRVLEGLSALSGSSAVETALASAPIDDESVTDEEAQAIEEGERDVEAGRVVTADEVQVRLGL
jgi:predicted transcriptional regulator